MFHFAESGGEPLGALNSSLQVSCQFGDWAWVVTGRVVARRMRQIRVRMRWPLEEDGLASPPQRAKVLVGDPGSLDNPPFARSAKDGPPGSWAGADEDGRPPDDAQPHLSAIRPREDGAPEFGLAECARFEVVLGGSMVIIGDSAGERPGRHTLILNGRDSERRVARADRCRSSSNCCRGS